MVGGGADTTGELPIVGDVRSAEEPIPGDAGATGVLPTAGDRGADVEDTDAFMPVRAGEEDAAADDDAPVPGVLVFRPSRHGSASPDETAGAGELVDVPPAGRAEKTDAFPPVGEGFSAEATGSLSRRAAGNAVARACRNLFSRGAKAEGPADRGGKAARSSGGARFVPPSDHAGLRRALWGIGLALGAVVLVGGGFALGTRFGDQVVDAVFPSVAANRPLPEAQTVELTDGYDGSLSRRVSAAAADVVAYALDAPSLDEVTAGAITGVLTSAGDMDAAYLTQEEYERYQRLAAGVSVGVGASFIDGRDGAVVALVGEGSPADEAGLTPGDTIVAVNGERRSWSSAELTDALAGEVGAQVELTWIGPDSQAAQEPAGADEGAEETTATMSLVDDGAPIVASRLDGTTGILTLLRFAPGAADRLASAIDDLVQGGATSFVLDLRDNPGGELSEFIHVASLFMEGGTIATAATRDGVERLEVTPGLYVTDAPLVVLVSNNTASAAELLAGALQDHQRALIAGELTHGKGSSQTLRTLSFGGALSYTTATYETPDGTAIQHEGIAPDLLVAPASRTEERLAASAQGQADPQLTAAVGAALSWQQGGSVAIEGLSNAPGPQQEAFEQARTALESAREEAIAARVASISGSGAAQADADSDATAEGSVATDATAAAAENTPAADPAAVDAPNAGAAEANAPDAVPADPDEGVALDAQVAPASEAGAPTRTLALDGTRS